MHLLTLTVFSIVVNVKLLLSHLWDAWLSFFHCLFFPIKYLSNKIPYLLFFNDWSNIDRKKLTGSVRMLRSDIYRDLALRESLGILC